MPKPLKLTMQIDPIAAQGRLKLEPGKRSAPAPAGAAYEPFVPGPNPNLETFIKLHSTHYDPAADKYNVPAFDRDLVVDKAAKPKAIYDMHSYWSKKHWAAIREYIRHYLPEKYYPRGTGLVLDCFSGSGMTGVAAMMEDRPCVLIDASPAAAFISHCYTHPVDPDQLRQAYDRMMSEPYPAELRQKLKKITGQEITNLQAELDWLYATRCDRCSGEAFTEYVVYSERFQCPNCAEVVALFDCKEERVPYPVGGKRSEKTTLKKRCVCPNCLAKSHGHAHRDFVVSTRTKRFGSVPVLVSYRCENGCKPSLGERRHNGARNKRPRNYFEDHDIGKLKKIDDAQIPHVYPRRKMMDVEDDTKPWGTEWRPGRNFRTVAELYTKRNLWALAATMEVMKAGAQQPQALQLALMAMVLGVSRMNRYVPGHWSVQNRILAGTYYLPQLATEVNIAPQLENKIHVVVAAQTALSDTLVGSALVSNEDTRSAKLNPPLVDYIFTDPSYVDKVQYGELNFVWEAWLGFQSSWLKDEIVVNLPRGKTLDEWDHDLRIALANCFAALKPGRWLSLCYHDTDPSTWTRVQNILLDTGLQIFTVTVLNPKQPSLNQLFAEKVVKSDLVINCRKPKPNEYRGDGGGEVALVSRRVRDILIDTLTAIGGQSRDKLWDTVLKRLLARSQMAEHRFNDILREVAFQSESGRWYLKEEFEELSEDDIKNEENAGRGLTRFAALRCVGVPASFAAEIVLQAPKLADEIDDEKPLIRYIRDHFIKDGKESSAFKLGGVQKGVEFYDCLFFYLTRWLKGRPEGTTPRRNLADFLDEYLVRFREVDRWLYRLPNDSEAAELREARRSGLGRRIGQFIAFLNKQGDYPKERMPDLKTIVAWLRHCAAFGLAEEGATLYEKGGLVAQLAQLPEDDRYNAMEYYQSCKRHASRGTGDDIQPGLFDDEGEQDNEETPA